MKKLVRNSLIFLVILMLFTISNGSHFPVVAEHIHNEDCGYVVAQDEIPCDQNCVDIDGDGVIDHVDNCSYQSAVEGQPCQYEIIKSDEQESTNNSFTNSQNTALNNTESETLSFSDFNKLVNDSYLTNDIVDLQGKTVILEKDEFFKRISTYTNLTIKNGTFLKSSDNTNASFAYVQGESNYLTFENVVFDGNNAPFTYGVAMNIYDSGHLSLKDCEFKNINAGTYDDQNGCGMIMGNVGKNNTGGLTLNNVNIHDCTALISYVYIKSNMPTSINQLRINGKYDPENIKNQCHGVMMETQWVTDLTITNSNISGCQSGIYMSGGNLNSQNNTITNNEKGVVADDYVGLNFEYHYTLNNDVITNNKIGVTYNNKTSVSNSLSLNGNVQITGNKNANLQLLRSGGVPVNVQTLTSRASIGIGVSNDILNDGMTLAKKDSATNPEMQDILSYFFSDNDGYGLTINNDTIVLNENKVNYINVNFETYGGDQITPVKVAENTTISKPTDPAKEGYEFIGWYSDDQLKKEWNFTEDKVNKDTTLYAKYKLKTYSIKYELNGGINNKQNPSSYSVEDNAITLKEPSRMGYTFVGWTYDGQDIPIKEVKISKGSTNDRKYTANWVINTYQVSFEDTGDIFIEPQILNFNTIVQEPENPTKADFIFDGWYTDQSYGNKWDFAKNKIQKDMKLFAKWIKPDDQNYIIGVNANDIYIIGDEVSFEAVGWGLDNENPKNNDIRYVPYSWSINPNGIWEQAPYKAEFVIENPGEYVLKVVFHKEVYIQGHWTYTSEDDIKTSKIIIKDKKDSTDLKDNTTDKKEEKEKSVVGVDTKDNSEINKYIGLLGISVFFVIFAKRREEA